MDNDYFKKLADRASQASKVPFRQVALACWEMQKNDCHRNVERWVQAHPESRAVRGWLFWPPQGGRYDFMAHSVIETNGDLEDITPMDKNTPLESLLFLKHEGEESDFLAMKETCSRVTYPPFTWEEWREAQDAFL